MCQFVFQSFPSANSFINFLLLFNCAQSYRFLCFASVLTGHFMILLCEGKGGGAQPDDCQVGGQSPGPH